MSKQYSYRDKNGHVIRKVCIDCEATLMKGNYGAKGRCHRCYHKYMTANADPEVKRIRRINAEAKKKGISGVLDVEEWWRMVEAQEGFCPRCNRETEYFTVDHILPLSKGGTNTIENIQPLCMMCNSYKNNFIEAPSFSYQKTLPITP